MSIYFHWLKKIKFKSKRQTSTIHPQAVPSKSTEPPSSSSVLDKTTLSANNVSGGNTLPLEILER